MAMAKSRFFGQDRAPKGDLAFVRGLIRCQIIRALNTIERVRRAVVYAWARRAKPRLVAQGDSWFCYPLPRPVDTLQHLSAHYAVKTLAGGGRRLSVMTQPQLLGRLARTIRRERPEAVLLSGGGVDVLDTMNARAVRPKGALPAFVAEGDHLNRAALGPVLQEVEARLVQLAETALAAGAPRVLLAGYDVLRVWPRPGQTIRDSLDRVGVLPKDQQAVVHRLMALLLAAQRRAADRVPGCLYVCGQGLASPYEDWHDEAHPHSAGTAKLAQALREALAHPTTRAT